LFGIQKADLNLIKHKISFSEAKSVLYDEFAIQFFDEDNSESKDRFIMLGMSNESRVLVVCHCERDEDESVYITSARKATHKGKLYEGE